ncbi:hypothetical protein C0585_06575 [Candidatus Woesearchaeota archaeon]|nr:MAG: hypothetical protein C0585_06575 [Candidatus Woesearchaeota archaeon]
MILVNNLMNGILLDTCYLIHLIKNNQLYTLEKKKADFNIGITSFNFHELERKTKELYLHYELPELFMVNIPFYPGHMINEKMFVNDVEPELLEVIDDPSNAVLAAAAIKFGAKKIITRDKQHLLNNHAKHLMEKYSIEISSDL